MPHGKPITRPIKSEKQRRLFGHWLSSPQDRPASMSEADVRAHLEQVKGENLVETTKKRMRKTFGV